MFQNLANSFQAAGLARDAVFLVHPMQLARWLDEAWAAGATIPPIPGATNPFLGSSAIIGDLALPTQVASPPFLVPSGISAANADQWTETVFQFTRGGLIWHHLMYAYLIESTGVVEVFAEVMRRLIQGEGLGELSMGSIKWLRSTEELFFRDPPLFSISGVVSELRPHARINRRQAFWRMFGFDIPHRIPAGEPGATEADSWKQARGLTANADFRAKWTELLRQVWMGLENRSNVAGANPTDPAYVALLCRALSDMMNDRRKGGLMAREEFAYVALLSWFDLTLESNTAIVRDLKAQGTFADERLRAIASRVGMQPAARTRELIQLAQPVSTVLREIELGLYSTSGGAAALFTGNTQLTRDMNEIINLWQSATGDRVKARPTGTASSGPAQPLRIPRPTPVAAGNGTKP
jgi:hypothetical protein